MQDRSRTVRELASTSVGQLNHGLAPRALLRGTESRDLKTLQRAAAALQRVRDPVAVDLLVRRIHYTFRATNFPRVLFRHETSRPYVRPYQLAPAGVDLEPVLDTVGEGTLLQHKVLVAEGTYTVTEVVEALAGLAPNADARDARGWLAWYNKTLASR